MNKMFKKLKRSKGIVRYFVYLVSIIYLITYILFCKSILQLKGIETLIRLILLIAFGIYLIIYLFFCYKHLIKRSYKACYGLSFLTIIFIALFIIGHYYIDLLYNVVGNTMESDKISYTSYLATLKENEFNKKSVIGKIDNSEDIEGFILADKLLKKEKIKNEVKLYESYPLMLKDLLDGKVDALLLPSNYTQYKNEDGLFEIGTKIKIIKKYTEVKKNDIIEVSDKDFNEPLTFLIMGVDSDRDGINKMSSFNGDTLMLFSLNPHNLKVTMVSIPRDTYVPIACNHDRYAKINSSSGFGTNCVLNTVGNLLDVKIDYYVKVNFKGVVELVDAVGGIDVDVEKPDVNYHQVLKLDCMGKFCEQNSNRGTGGNDIIYIKPGMQHLNGEEALAYSRSRYLYAGGDLDRIKHQQQVVDALLEKLLSFSSIGDIDDILKAVSNNLVTNMERNKILSGYNVAKKMLSNAIKGNNVISIDKAHLETYSLYNYVPQYKMYTSALGYYNDSLEDIQSELKETLDLKKPSMIKTFNFDVNEEFVLIKPGEGKRKNPSSFLLPDFVGKTMKEAENFCNEKGIKLNVSYVDSDSEYYNNDVNVGLICNQSIHKDVHLSLVNELTIYIKNSDKPEINLSKDSSEENTKNKNEIDQNIKNMIN